MFKDIKRSVRFQVGSDESAISQLLCVCVNAFLQSVCKMIEIDFQAASDNHFIIFT